MNILGTNGVKGTRKSEGEGRGEVLSIANNFVKSVIYEHERLRQKAEVRLLYS